MGVVSRAWSRLRSSLKRRGDSGKCPACQRQVANDSDAFFRSFEICFTCKCGGNVYTEGRGVDRLLGLNVMHSECRSIAYLPPTVWCHSCQQHFVSNWQSLVIHDRASEVASEVARAAQSIQGRHRRPFQAPPDAQQLHPPLIACRCDNCGKMEWWTPDGHGTLKIGDLYHEAPLRCFYYARWAILMMK